MPRPPCSTGKGSHTSIRLLARTAARSFTYSALAKRTRTWGDIVFGTHMGEENIFKGWPNLILIVRLRHHCRNYPALRIAVIVFPTARVYSAMHSNRNRPSTNPTTSQTIGFKPRRRRAASKFPAQVHVDMSAHGLKASPPRSVARGVSTTTRNKTRKGFSNPAGVGPTRSSLQFQELLWREILAEKMPEHGVGGVLGSSIDFA